MPSLDRRGDRRYGRAVSSAPAVTIGDEFAADATVDPDRDRSTSRRWLVMTRRLLLATYGIAYLVWFFEKGVLIDRISVTISVVTFVLIGHIGRPWRQLARLPLDFALYGLMWFAYEETRGAADRLGMPLQVESVRNIDRFLFFGVDPNVWLQDRLYEREVGMVDVVASLEYFTHFFVPIVAIAVLWVTNRAQWVRFMRRFATTLAIACAMFVVLPTAPPWMAGGGNKAIPLDALPRLQRTAGRGWRHIGLEGFVHVWDHGREWGNPVAAMPSLHAGYSMLVVAFFFPMIRYRRLRWLLLAHPLLMGFALVYLAEHYVIDVLAGWAVVGLSFLIWNRYERWRAAATPPDRPPSPAVCSTPPQTHRSTSSGS
jgi:membrane-associated phospholipid phosphatase